MIEASNGLEGVEAAKANQDRIHLLITDLVMPKLSGREMAERLTAFLPDLRILFMSGYTEDMILRQGVEAARADFLHKPFNLNELTSKVREILDRKSAPAVVRQSG